MEVCGRVGYQWRVLVVYECWESVEVQMLEVQAPFPRKKQVRKPEALMSDPSMVRPGPELQASEKIVYRKLLI